jgi:16S rRNA G1207 methylase RsmC
MFSVDMDDVGSAVDSVADIALPARRKEAERRLKLENAQREAEIQSLNAKTLLDKAHADRELAAVAKDQAETQALLAQAKKTEAEAESIQADAAKKRADALKIVEDMRLARIDVALKMIEKADPDLPEDKKISQVLKLLPHLNTVLDSPLELMPPKKLGS